jgi:hypothetical protein
MRTANFIVFAAGLLLLATHTAHADTVVIVSTSFPSDSISKADLARSFLGKPMTLPNGKAVTPVNLKPGATREDMQTKLLEKTHAQVEKHWARMAFTGNGSPPAEMADDAAMLKQVASDATAIGYVDSKSVTSSVKVLKVQ